jgi:ABC-2 type transport system ATP-binding protein
MLIVKNLNKHFGETTAVTNVSFEINQGEIFALIGPNSSGKTTIVKNIVGMLKPPSGTITIGGHDITTSPLEAKSVIGYIPDEPSVWPYMTGEEFLNFTQALFANGKHQHTSPVRSLLETFSLHDVQKNYFEDYSRGNKQKFSIIAAMSHNPKLLLIDEPIVGLDPTGAELAKKLFVDFKNNGGAILLVTHTLPVAQEIADRIGILKNGSLVAVGTMKELRKQAQLPETATLEEIYKQLA